MKTIENISYLKSSSSLSCNVQNDTYMESKGGVDSSLSSVLHYENLHPLALNYTSMLKSCVYRSFQL